MGVAKLGDGDLAVVGVGGGVLAGGFVYVAEGG